MENINFRNIIMVADVMGNGNPVYKFLRSPNALGEDLEEADLHDHLEKNLEVCTNFMDLSKWNDYNGFWFKRCEDKEDLQAFLDGRYDGQYLAGSRKTSFVPELCSYSCREVCRMLDVENRFLNKQDIIPGKSESYEDEKEVHATVLINIKKKPGETKEDAVERLRGLLNTELCMLVDHDISFEITDLEERVW